MKFKMIIDGNLTIEKEIEGVFDSFTIKTDKESFTYNSNKEEAVKMSNEEFKKLSDELDEIFN